MTTKTSRSPKTKSSTPRWSSPTDWKSPCPEGGKHDRESRGGAVVRWIESNCVYGEGDWFGQPVRLRDFQQRFITRLYEYCSKCGKRRYKRALLGVAKGNGKTPLAAWVGAHELFRRDIAFPHVIIGAASYDQADLVFGDLSICVSQSETLKPYVKTFQKEIQLVEPMHGIAERIAAEAATNDGARATVFLPDELHEWIGRIGRVYTIVDGAVAKRRGAFTFAISTAGVLGESLLFQLYEHGRRLALGMEDDDSFLFEWYEPPDEIDLETEEGFETAVRAANPAYGDFLDPENLKHRFKTMPRFEFERYHLNRWTAALQRWLPIEDWDACKGEPEIPKDAEVFVGIDYGKKRDTTAVVVVFKDGEGVLHVAAKVFSPDEGRYVEREDVLDHVKKLSLAYDVREYLYDPRLFEETAERLEEEGYPMVEVPQSIPRKARFAQALYDAVAQRRLRHGGDPVLRAHADASVAKEHQQGDVWTIERAKEGVANDAIIALAMAVEAADQDEGSYMVMDDPLTEEERREAGLEDSD